MANIIEEHEEGQWQDEQSGQFKQKSGNNLPIWGNPRTMNLNHLVLTNIQNSSYFKVRLFELKTYHEVVDEIYYKVEHLEPWERGTRKTAGQTGMCGGVRGVGAGGVVSTAFCCLFKLFTLKLTRKQVNGLLNHPDSPYIRGLGIMYVRFTQPPKDLWDWFEPFLDDEEELDVKSGGGCMMTIGMMIRTVLTKLEWFATLFPRIPVPIEKQIHEYLKERGMTGARGAVEENDDRSDYRRDRHEADARRSNDRGVRSSRDKSRERSYQSSRRTRTPEKRHRSRSRDRDRNRNRSRDRDRNRSQPHSRERRRSRERRSRSRDRPRRHRSRSRDRDRRRKSRSRSRDRHRSYRSR